VEILLHLLLEHQSSVDPKMPFRLLEYMVGYWRLHLQEHGLPLPCVIPLVLNQGPKSWEVSKQFQRLFAIPEDLQETLRPFTPAFEHLLVNLPASEPENDFQDDDLQIAMLLMKAVRDEKASLAEFFEYLNDIFPRGEAHFRLFLLYVANITQMNRKLDVRAIFHKLTKPRLKSEFMTIAEFFKLEGIEAGREEGREAGREEGRLEGVELGLEKGEVIGKILLLEKLLMLPPSDSAHLQKLSLEESRAEFARLEAIYDLRFKS
jgi:predicted transposase/invertase (TIGR01784 family)